MKRLLFFFSLWIWVPCFAQPEQIIILHTNDHHGHYNAFDDGVGGLSAQKTYIDQVRAQALQEKKHLLVLSGGDINTGTFESDLQKAEPDFKGMNQIGYDAMAVGNHEWDNPLEVILMQQQWAGFPFLSANTRYKDTQKHVFLPHVIICFPRHQPECKFKVGLLGLTTPETKHLVSPDLIENIAFTDPTQEAKKVIRKLKKQKVDLIIALTHMGHDGPEKDAKGNVLYRDVRIAKTLKKLDVIVGGHTQVALPEPIIEGKTLVLQAQEWGKYVGHLELTLTQKAKRYQKKDTFNYQLVPINLHQKGTIKEDPAMLNFFEPFNQKAQQLGDQSVGYLDQAIEGTRNQVRSKPMLIGSWITYVFKKSAKADLAMMNAGGIRAGLAQGKITKKDIHAVHPFGNTLVYVTLSPTKLYQYLKEGYQNIQASQKELLQKTPDLQGAYPQYAGVQLKIKDQTIQAISSTDPDNPWEIQIEQNQVTQSTKDQYRLATINFIAKGGDGYPILIEDPSYVDTGLTVDHLLIQFFKQSKTTTLQTLKNHLQKHPPIQNFP